MPAPRAGRAPVVTNDQQRPCTAGLLTARSMAGRGGMPALLEEPVDGSVRHLRPGLAARDPIPDLQLLLRRQVLRARAACSGGSSPPPRGIH